MTFKEFIAGLWKNHLSKRQPSTVDTYGSFTRHYLLPKLGEKLLTDITPRDISELLDGVKLAPGSVAMLYRILRSMFNPAAEYDLIESTPAPQAARAMKLPAI